MNKAKQEITTTTIGLAAGIESLEALMGQLQAHRVTAAWLTSHGVVEITVPGPRVLVNGEEVPMDRAD
jgi:hypothetical protein